MKTNTQANGSASKKLKALLNLTHTERTYGEMRHVGFRPAGDVRVMLQRAVKDHPEISKIVNACLRDSLTRLGYGDGKLVAAVQGKAPSAE